ncbi:MAG TPA: hypothetical protein VFN36_05880 [Solirubrobacteraceae bacterium]|nr:hypothetical protein [Solirubrobacteraceae bacterium]
MNDDWRVHVTCPTTATAAELGELLRTGEVQHELEAAAGQRVIVSLDGRELFLYAGTREQAERATAAVGSLVARSGLTVQTDLRRWHPVAEEWVNADAPLPLSEADRAAEHAELIEQQHREQAELRYAEWEVRVSTASHRETVELADALRAAGIPALRRWRFLLVGAADKDAARTLAQRIEALAPGEAHIEVEASYPTIEAEVGPNPFAVFGGLGV